MINGEIWQQESRFGYPSSSEQDEEDKAWIIKKVFARIKEVSTEEHEKVTRENKQDMQNGQ